MAPEKIKITEKGYSIKSDIWSLGITLLEICTGIHPYIHAKGPFDLSSMILLNDSPQLDSSKYSKEFCFFVDLW
jgi:serine/threonine protein kinase